MPLTLNVLTNCCVVKFSVCSSVLLTKLFTSRALVTCPVIDGLNVSHSGTIAVTINNAIVASALTLLLLAIVINVTANGISRDF